MSSEEQIKQALEKVLVPGGMRSLVQLNLVRQVTVSDQKVSISLASAALDDSVQEWLKHKVQDAIMELSGVKESEVVFVPAQPKELNQISHVVAVMSGKGGVRTTLLSGEVRLSAAPLSSFGRRCSGANWTICW